MENRKQIITWGCVSLFLSAIFNWFFLFNSWGISVLVFNVLNIGFGWFAFRKHAAFNAKIFGIYSVVLLILSIPFVRFDFMLFKFFNFFLMLAVYGLMVHMVLPFSLPRIIVLTLHGLFSPIVKLNAFIAETKPLAQNKKGVFRNVILGLLIALPVLSIVVPLLLSADAVFDSGVKAVFGVPDEEKIAELVIRVIFLVSFFLYFYSRHRHKPEFAFIEKTVTPRMTMNLTFANVFLISIDLVYLVFSYVQIKYLFLGNQLPEGMDYATYAREGFFQLVFVTVINVIILLIFNYFKEKHISVNVLLMVTVVCTYIMTASAFYKMSMYESTYGYTRLRLLVYIYLIGQTFGLVPVVIGIFKPHFKYLEVAVLGVFIYYLLVSFINVDGFVTERNIDRQKREVAVELDAAYIGTLSADAIPAFEAYVLDNENEDIIDQTGKEVLKNSIINKYANTDKSAKWFSYNLSIAHLKRVYNEVDPSGEAWENSELYW